MVSILPHETIAILQENITSIQINRKYKNIYLCGDINFHLYDQNSANAQICLNSDSIENIELNKLIDIMNEYYLIQTVKEHTKGRNILDYVMTNNQSSVSHNIVIKSCRFSDYNTIIIVVNIKYGCEKIIKIQFNI